MCHGPKSLYVKPSEGEVVWYVPILHPFTASKDFESRAPSIYGKVFEGDVDSHFLGLWTVYSKHEYYETQIHR